MEILKPYISYKVVHKEKKEKLFYVILNIQYKVVQKEKAPQFIYVILKNKAKYLYKIKWVLLYTARAVH